MNTGDLLLRAVLCDPGDDTARLAFADYLEENGRGLHARFVRDQIAGVVRMVPLSMLVPLEPLTGVMSHQTTRHATARGCVVTCDRVELVFGRGFVDEVRLPAAAFTEGFARELFSSHPVMKVVLTDRDPWTDAPDGGCDYGWWEENEYRIHADGPNDPGNVSSWLFRGMWRANPANRNSDESGRWLTWDDDNIPPVELSAACVAWGRSLAGLPPLPHASGGA